MSRNSNKRQDTADNLCQQITNDAGCTYKQGPLPECAPLAVPYTAFQTDGKPQYNADEALTRGTLFPGLDLPFMNTVNRSNPYAGTPMGELMALQFMIKELQLYLDTHPDDAEAFATLKNIIALSSEGQARFAAKYGPITIGDVKYSSSYTWTDGPWPWEYNERTGG